MFDDKPIKNRLWHRMAIDMSLESTPVNEIAMRSTFIFIALINTYVAAPFIAALCFWIGNVTAAFNPILASVIMTVCFTCLSNKGRYHDVVIIHQVLILIMPILLQFSLGGLEKSGGVMLGSALCPLGAAFFSKTKHALFWIKTYVACLIMTLCVEYLSPWCTLTMLQCFYLFMNICGTVSITFFGVFSLRVRLDMEHKRSENLLENVLPKSIKTRLKNGESQIIENFDDVTILFADLKGFTKVSADLPPSFLIGRFLGDVFSAWDNICANYTIDKIKTIGDAFMAVGGIEEDKKANPRSADAVALDVVLLGLEMQQALDFINERYGMEFTLRIGIHSGPVIAGVIGLKKFCFDVWGDAVNTASRMESHGIPGCIHLSMDTYNKVKEYLSGLHLNSFCRGEIDVKGKGKMTTYIIQTERNHLYSNNISTSLFSRIGHPSGISSVEE